MWAQLVDTALLLALGVAIAAPGWGTWLSLLGFALLRLAMHCGRVWAWLYLALVATSIPRVIIYLTSAE